ncbi:transcriptional regulator [Streptomyces rectiverticillatus]|uniref:transcriptional regulator n=1 Tax=Streptomyces rectiverticillatus TaxID=173860 RepID=UPI0015C306A6|nr:transcriptional regulator [Streptomyces rectiverticillatus]QLE74581.1 transcriptional regulator [Streptomyces rectiverticillatus]
MTRTAQEVLADAVRGLAPGEGANRLVPLIAAGEAPREVIAAFALEQHHVIAADRRSFAHLAGRAAGDPAAARFFASLAQGEDLALPLLGPLALACRLDEEAVRSHEPRPGCQAYPSYVAWLALNAEPVDVVVALTANFAAWGGYCAAVGAALREHYGFDNPACGFFDFFAGPAPEVEERSVEAVEAGLAGGRLSEPLAHRYGRLLQAYELMFWDGLAAR